MSKKFKQILESKNRNKTYQELSDSNGYIIVHEICTDKNLQPAQKMELIDRFCHSQITVQEIADSLQSVEDF